MNKTTHNLVQGSPEWAEHRARCFNASEAPVVLGVSKYQSRSELLHEKATGISKDIDAATQAVFDDGHRFEAMARPLAEKLIGDELYSPTVSIEIDGLLLSASFDGATMMEDVIWEHKSKNKKLAESLSAGIIPEQYKPQLEQQLLIMGADKCLFMASNGDHESALYAWYESDPVLRASLIAAWKQFAMDLAAYVPTAPAVEVIGRAPDDLPALRIEVTGMVTASNLDAFKANALAVFSGINRELSTDTDFANAEKTVKWCAGIEEKLKAAKEHALSQTETIDLLFKTIDGISAEARATRLELEKLVKARKDAVRVEIQQKAGQAFTDHILQLNKRLGKVMLPAIHADFAGVMKGKKTVASLQDAVDTELARVKIESSTIADKIDINLGSLRELANNHIFLFSDAQQLVMKANDDLVLLIKSRIAEHEAAEKARIEREVQARVAEEQRKADEERLRVEREAKAAADRAEAEAKRKAEQEALDAVKTTAPVAEAPVAVAPAPVPEAAAAPAMVATIKPEPSAPHQPANEEILMLVANHFGVSESVAYDWLVAGFSKQEAA